MNFTQQFRANISCSAKPTFDTDPGCLPITCSPDIDYFIMLSNDLLKGLRIVFGKLGRLRRIGAVESEPEIPS